MRLAQRHGALFGEKAGWERVNWYESNAANGDEALRPDGWAGRHWSPAIGSEHVATRERAGLFDESSFAKLEIEYRPEKSDGSLGSTVDFRYDLKTNKSF